MSPLLAEVIARLADCRILERYLTPAAHERAVYGQLEGGRVITINPVPAVVDTLIHEGVHAVDLTYSEATVNRLTSRLLAEMTEEQVKLLYGIYKQKLSR